jgi:hypothetical protein
MLNSKYKNIKAFAPAQMSRSQKKQDDYRPAFTKN